MVLINLRALQELKFCYDTDNFRKDLIRLMDLGAEEYRVCKRVHTENPSFCAVKKKEVTVLPGTRQSRGARGIIYE